MRAKLPKINEEDLKDLENMPLNPNDKSILVEPQVRRNFGKPTRANTTGKATAADTVYTKEDTAKWIINYYKPEGSVLDASAGKDIFYNNFANEQKYRCEITDGIDFFDWNKKVDWIITNPPYSIYDRFLQHCFNIADNVVLFVPIAKAFKSNKVQKMVNAYGGLKEIIYMGGGNKHGFAFGFPVGCLYYKRGYIGDCRIVTKIPA